MGEAALKRWRMHGPVIMEADILKQNEKTGVSHLRHFILYDHVLIYRHPKTHRIIGVIPVEIIRFCGFRKDDQTNTCFHLILRGATQISGKGTIKESKRIFALQTRTAEEAAVWVGKLKQLQLKYEKSEPVLDRRGRYWLKLGKQASTTLDGAVAGEKDSGSEWEATEEDEENNSRRTRTSAAAASPESSTEFRVEKLKSNMGKAPEATTLMEGYLSKRLRAAKEARVLRSTSVVSSMNGSTESKTGGKRDETSWVKRYFTLTDKELFYGLERDGQVVGILPLEVIQEVHLLTGSVTMFQVIVAGEPRGHTFELQAGSADAASKWVKALSSQLQHKQVVDCDTRGLYWLTLAATRRSTVLDAEITSEECAEIPDGNDSDDDNLSLSQSGRRPSKACSPFACFATQSTQGFVIGMDKPNQDNYANARLFGGHDGAFFGVFDGHGPNGHYVSAFLRQWLPSQVLAAVNTDISSLQALQAVPKAYASAFLACNERLNKELAGKLEFSGSTAVLCHLRKQGEQIYLWSSNVGDSRAVLAKQAGEQTFLAIPLSCDHLPTCPAEKKRIEAAGGRVGPNQHGKGSSRVWLKSEDIPGLAVSRAFGDAIASRIGVISEPEVWVRTLTPNDAFIILASDGLWEFMSCQEVVDIVAESFQANGERNAEKAAKLLVTAAELRWAEEEAESRDDITVTVVFL